MDIRKHKKMSIIVCLYLITVNFFTNVIGAPSSRQDLPENDSVKDENVDLNEDISVPKISRKGLYEILHNNQFFQDFFYDHLAPLKYQFGHVCENPTEWEQRFEQRDFEKNHHQGKVLWGNVNGNYGEHYWDLASGR